MIVNVYLYWYIIIKVGELYNCFEWKFFVGIGKFILVEDFVEGSGVIFVVIGIKYSYFCFWSGEFGFFLFLCWWLIVLMEGLGRKVSIEEKCYCK